MSSSQVVRFVPSEHESLLPGARDLQIACVLKDHTLARFLPPFPPEKRSAMLITWQTYGEAVAAGRRHILLHVTTEDGVDKVTGVVTLGMSSAETGPFRGDVELLLVSPDHRLQ